MLVQTVKYVNFKDQPLSKVLRFNLTKTELLDHLELKDKFEKMAENFQGEDRELTTEEIKTVLSLVKEFVQMSYGIMDADGEHFVKSDEAWAQFQHSAVYDAFLMGLFEQGGEAAIQFMTAIIPSDMRADVQAEASKSLDKDFEKLTTQVPELPTAPPVVTTGPKDEVDVNALLASMPADDAPTPLEPITQKQHDFLKERLSEEQFAKHMENKHIVG